MGGSSRKNQSSRYQLKRILRNNATLLLTFIVFLVLIPIYFFAIRSHDVELSFNQLSAFERQIQTIGNYTIYIVDPLKNEDEILSTFSRKQWSKVSTQIDYIAFIYDEIDAVIGPSWVSGAITQFKNHYPNGYGMMLFSCGCIIPNLIFTEMDVRFNGFECSLLPAFVIPKNFISFVNTTLPTHRCSKRDAVLGRQWYDENIEKLGVARSQHRILRETLRNPRQD